MQEVAKHYAIALADVCKDKLEEAAMEMAELLSILKEVPTFRLFYESPKIKKEEKVKVMQKVFGNEFVKPIQNLLQLLLDKGRATLLVEIGKEFIAEANRRLNKIEADLILPRKFSEEELTEIKKRAQQLIESRKDLFGLREAKEIVFRTEENQNLLAGFILKLEDYMVDASASHFLKQWKQQLKDKKLKGLEKALQE
ncbi:MAG: ATP synthase F1 subunit delta [Candidatus Hydrogenedentota bacterium]|nr:MAG: ATP synthase F1 subunit delta [Candidatus Hydrogenedentota bacterium]